MDSVNWHEIRQLLAALDESSVAELTLEVDTFRLLLRKGAPVQISPIASPAVVDVVAPVPEPSRVQPVATVPNSISPPDWVEVTSPMVGTFYSAPAPDDADFVKLGDSVRKGQTLCIVEAMKLMNEIEAESSGRVAEILVKNSEPVEFGQVLMRIDPNG